MGRRAAQDVPSPFVKWVGGKRQLLAELRARLPARFKRYHEPFLGGGALFFDLVKANRLHIKTWPQAILTDLNDELIATYQAIKDDVEAVIAALQQHRYDKDHFLTVRALAWRNLLPPAIAARMIFLNRAGFNGLYRVNAKGQFNVPFGRYSHVRLVDADNLRAVASALRLARLQAGSFELALDQAERGDLVYFDPPYVPLTKTARFVGYASAGFALAQQERLAEVFATLAGRGVHVLLSNSDCPWVHQHYAAFQRDQVFASRLVNSQADKRGAVSELIVLGLPPRPRVA